MNGSDWSGGFIDGAVAPALLDVAKTPGTDSAPLDVNKRFIFIGGLHRSGTSLLHRALQAHSSISGFVDTGVPENEGQHLQTVFPTASVYGGPGKFCFARDAYLDEASPFATPENRERLMQQWGRHWNPDKSIFIEKSPPNLIRTRFLQALFPNSQFIIIVRHPLAGSYATQKWSKTSIRELVEHWNIAHQRMLGDLPFIKQWHLIRYEDFVENPEAVLTNIFRWLGLEPAAFHEKVDPAINRKYFAWWETEAAKSSALLKMKRSLHALPNQFGYYFTSPYTQPYQAGSQDARRAAEKSTESAIEPCAA